MVMKNIKGKTIKLSKLSDNDLVKLYRFTQSYCNIFKTMNIRDGSGKYKKYIEEIYSIRDKAKDEIKKRKLKLANFCVK